MTNPNQEWEALIVKLQSELSRAMEEIEKLNKEKRWWWEQHQPLLDKINELRKEVLAAGLAKVKCDKAMAEIEQLKSSLQRKDAALVEIRDLDCHSVPGESCCYCGIEAPMIAVEALSERGEDK